MKALRVFLGILTLFLYLPVNIYAGYLMYQHVHATELMWFLWFLSTPLIIFSSVVGVIADKFVDKK